MMFDVELFTSNSGTDRLTQALNYKYSTLMPQILDIHVRKIG